MSDVRWYAVWPNPRSRSRALQCWKSGRFQKLSPPPWILKLVNNIWIWSGQISDIWPSFCVTWLWSWQKRQLWRVDCQSRTWLIYLVFTFHAFTVRQWRRSIMFSGCLSVCLFVRIDFLARYLMNSLNSLDETYREYSLAPTDDLLMTWLDSLGQRPRSQKAVEVAKASTSVEVHLLVLI